MRRSWQVVYPSRDIVEDRPKETVGDDTPQSTDSQATVEPTETHMYRFGVVLIRSYQDEETTWSAQRCKQIRSYLGQDGGTSPRRFFWALPPTRVAELWSSL